MALYEKPDWLTKHVFNPLVSLLTNLGVSVRGSRILVVRGRKSGQIRTTPVNPLEIGGKRYLVVPRGETEWPRNLRAARGGELRLGRHRDRGRGAFGRRHGTDPARVFATLERHHEVLPWRHGGVPRLRPPTHRCSAARSTYPGLTS